MITTLFFDLGEVVLTNDWTFVCPQKDKEFFAYYGIDTFSYAKNPFTQDLFTGKMSEYDFWKNALNFYHAHSTDPTKAIAIARKYQQAKPEMLPLLEALKKKGYTLGAITNTHKELLEWKIQAFHLSDYFSHIVGSCEVGITKPDFKIFDFALQKFKVSPDVCVFIDDSGKNVSAAEQVGMHGIVFTDKESLIQSFKTMGVAL